ncbi:MULTISPECIES: Arc family DNA-binding protein [Brenneria]|uniref:Arc family DNA-binding protein n=1 Tax=Brenneria nigrifluens DSM 30175 = ATCC 13028 TaxID=1121120 RepID=A0A2U1UU45_9GAMM|nr:MULTISPECIES: Arc family DNA-binding protein [Brenneria]PWC25132.1 Arc family DNA-binding protein [Brenneria nigrifluens DSM 30175 = ATCC 13028]QCR04889.1 Arc family DNA-binding protein [Brenneria nigrifluens DSM 30175 = ATCC 13028]
MSRITPYPLRMPAEMRERLESEAKESGRSLQQEVMKRLEVSMALDELTGVAVEYLPTLVEDLQAGIEQVKVLKSENNELSKKLKNLQSEVSASFSISGTDRSNLALMKLKKAYAHISSGLDEIKNLIPEDSK